MSSRAASRPPSQPTSYATFTGAPPEAANEFDVASLHPQREASWISRMLLLWVSPLMQLGNERHITEHDIWPLQHQHQSNYVAVRFGEDYSTSGSLVVAFLKSFGGRFALTGFASFIAAICSLIGPLVLNQLVSALTSTSYNISSLLWWIGFLFVAQIVQALADNYVTFDSQVMAIQFTGAVKHLIYQKAMLLNSDARRQKTVGEITTLYTMDCAHMIRTISIGHQLWILPLQIIAVSALLFWLLGVASFAGIALITLVLYMNHNFSSTIQKLQVQFTKIKDVRVKKVTETFRSISMVKFSSWEARMEERISEARKAEVDSIMGYFRLDIARTVLTSGAPIFISVVTFAVYTGLLRHELSPSLVFTSLSLFRLIQQPLRQIAGIYSTLIRVRVSANRMAEFFSLAELTVTQTPNQGSTTETGIVTVEDGAFTWDTSSPIYSLKRVNLRVHKGDFAVIHGPVGCGKSSLCSAVLGEMIKIRGRVQVQGRVAFCSQQPWIQNMTLRDNILFGYQFNQQRYDAVLDACALTYDLASLPAGDQTEIGERGVNLSGGQKARVALARACYANADVYILDAPLAAVDTIVANEIFQKCLLGLLSNKTIILVTHNPEIIHSKHITSAITISAAGELVETMQRRSKPPPQVSEYAFDPLHTRRKVIHSLYPSLLDQLEVPVRHPQL